MGIFFPSLSDSSCIAVLVRSSVAVFLCCGLVSKNHMLLNLPGILVPQKANHLLPGLSLRWLGRSSSDAPGSGPTERALRCEDHCLLTLPALDLPLPSPTTPSPLCQNKSLSWVNRLPIPIEERGIKERADETVLCSPHFTPLFYITRTLSFWSLPDRWTSLERIYCIPSF